MKQFVAALAPFAVLALLGVGYCAYTEAIDAAVERVQTQARTDSLKADAVARAERASIRAAADREKRALLDSLTRLGRTYRANLTILQDTAASRLAALESHLAADTTMADTTRAAITGAVRALSDQVAGCSLVVATCEHRAQLWEERYWARDSAAREDSTRADRNLDLYNHVLKRRRPSRWGFNVMAGLAILRDADGVVRAGPGATVGFGYRF